MIAYRSRKKPFKSQTKSLSLFYGFFRMIFDWKTDPSCEYNWRWKTSPPPPLLSCSRTDVRWESPMKWKYNHIWIDWFLLGVRPHKQDPMGCHLPQSCCNSSIHNRNRKKMVYVPLHHLWKSLSSEARVVNFSFWNFVMPPSNVTFLVETFGGGIRVSNSNILMV